MDRWGRRESGQKLGDGLVCSGEDQRGPEVGERLQNESPDGESRMGDSEFGVFEREIPCVEEVEIEGARGVVPVFNGSALRVFDFLERAEKLQRFEVGRDLCHGVQIGSRAGFAIDRIGFVDP